MDLSLTRPHLPVADSGSIEFNGIIFPELESLLNEPNRDILFDPSQVVIAKVESLSQQTSEDFGYSILDSEVITDCFKELSDAANDDPSLTLLAERIVNTSNLSTTLNEPLPVTVAPAVIETTPTPPETTPTSELTFDNKATPNLPKVALTSVESATTEITTLLQSTPETTPTIEAREAARKDLPSPTLPQVKEAPTIIMDGRLPDHNPTPGVGESKHTPTTSGSSNSGSVKRVKFAKRSSGDDVDFKTQSGGGSKTKQVSPSTSGGHKLLASHCSKSSTAAKQSKAKRPNRLPCVVVPTATQNAEGSSGLLDNFRPEHRGGENGGASTEPAVVDHSITAGTHSEDAPSVKEKRRRRRRTLDSASSDDEGMRSEATASETAPTVDESCGEPYDGVSFNGGTVEVVLPSVEGESLADQDISVEKTSPVGQTVEKTSPVGQTVEKTSPVGLTVENTSPVGQNSEIGAPAVVVSKSGRKIRPSWRVIQQAEESTVAADIPPSPSHHPGKATKKGKTVLKQKVCSEPREANEDTLADGTACALNPLAPMLTDSPQKDQNVFVSQTSASTDLVSSPSLLLPAAATAGTCLWTPPGGTKMAGLGFTTPPGRTKMAGLGFTSFSLSLIKQPLTSPRKKAEVANMPLAVIVKVEPTDAELNPLPVQAKRAELKPLPVQAKRGLKRKLISTEKNSTVAKIKATANKISDDSIPLKDGTKELPKRSEKDRVVDIKQRDEISFSCVGSGSLSMALDVILKGMEPAGGRTKFQTAWSEKLEGEVEPPAKRAKKDPVKRIIKLHREPLGKGVAKNRATAAAAAAVSPLKSLNPFTTSSVPLASRETRKKSPMTQKHVITISGSKTPDPEKKTNSTESRVEKNAPSLDKCGTEFVLPSPSPRVTPGRKPKGIPPEEDVIELHAEDEDLFSEYKSEVVGGSKKGADSQTENGQSFLVETQFNEDEKSISRGVDWCKFQLHSTFH